ncbi:hypothetical protein DFH08DRAFT_891419 [Mycena albidolilacea]|uniref:Uncharacterized protein n=1 Tax=Mycena albidolilacea TaxID=1033008 RepID=A0AAD6ZE77_9AGAR|nr:hypothetical protein DFH08DRAFT_891419 [Mycena albidolilacea]
MSAATNATTSIPSAPGCWGNSESAVSACCSLFGGVRLVLPDSSIPACGYNIGSRFTADTGSTSDANSTTGRWSSCIASHFNATAEGTTVVLSTCQNSQSQIATVTSKPESTASATGTSGAGDLLVFRRQGHLGRGILAGIVVTGGLLHILSLAI